MLRCLTLTARRRQRCPRCGVPLLQWLARGATWCNRCGYEREEDPACVRVSTAFLQHATRSIDNGAGHWDGRLRHHRPRRHATAPRISSRSARGALRPAVPRVVLAASVGSCRRRD